MKTITKRLMGQHQGFHICPICCILPPYMTDHIILSGSQTQREWALGTLRASEQFRGRREAIGATRFMAPAGTKRRTIYSAKNATDLPGTLVRGEGDPPTGDIAADEAYDGSGATYDFYYDVFHNGSDNF